MDAEQPAPKPGLLDHFFATPFTFFMIAVNIAVFIKAESVGSTLDPAILIRFGANERVHVWAGEYWRLFTSTILHIGWIHLAVNTIFGYSWCVTVEKIFGPWRFMVLYLATGIGASAVSILGHNVVGAGASGSLFGVIGATIVLRARLLGGFRKFMADPPSKNLMFTIGFWFLLGATTLPMDNYAHLGGLVFGMAFTAVFLAPRNRRVILAIAVAVIWVGTVAASTHRWPYQRAKNSDAVSEFERGNALYHENHPEEALDHYQRAAELGLDDPALDFNRGQAHSMVKNWEAAERSFTSAIEKKLPGPGAWAGRGEARSSLGRIDEARADFEKALSLATKDWMYRSDVETWLKEHPRAVK